ncbi:ABC transporter ATP-binding protein [Enterococcus ureasiticus]|uniref:ABC transporter domain-containing protein n=1 Tax=Enterococcus ureasiticus TaxID=903984 RepID=A0A1E5GAF3_9ENTE|nr:ABC transporter ATP-binding protein [Enterococcus ureasiticus]OEG09575.1 hypothetical protein BCR21_14605 [Enterococcus ureasiticus]
MIFFEDVQIKFNDFIAIDQLNLRIKEGEFFTLLGPSGCGKTTTLRSLVGFIKPSKGNVYLNDKIITHEPVEKRNISMVFQSYALFPTMTVYDNIEFGLKVKKIDKQKSREMVKEIAKKVDLDPSQLQKNVSELSGGQQQRVAIARALVLQPNILVLDEPLSNLDARLRVQLRNELKELQKKFGITTIYVTHDQEEALTLSDRIAVFNKGKVEQVGTPEEIYNRSQTEFVCNFIGDINNVTPLKHHFTPEISQQEKCYIRIEKVHLNQKAKTCDVQLSGEISAIEFYGIYTKYTIRLEDGTALKVIEKGVQLDELCIDAKVTIGMNETDLLTYS